MILVDHVTKNFGRLKAINDISFTIKQGEIVGFLGQNGAGKTTLMRMLTSYLLPSAGKVVVAGHDVMTAPILVRAKIGYLSENPPLYDHMTTREYLRFAAQLKNISHRQERTHIDRVLTACDLKEVEHKTIGILSKGFKQRIGIAQAIINDPEVLILDEPTNGLDPIQILQVRALIKSLEHKHTVIISTHILSEIEHIAQRILIIKSGHIVADASLKNLLTAQEASSLEEAFIKLCA